MSDRARLDIFHPEKTKTDSTATSRVLPYQTGSNSTVELEDYDYVVVGSGPGGAPLAARLALAGHKILVIEAGGDHYGALEQQVPALHLISTEYEPMRWDFFVNHYPTLEDQQKDSKMTWRTPEGKEYVGTEPPVGSEPLGVLYPRSGTLGGCAAHNAMVTVYPHESDWDNLVDVTGDDTWNGKNMRKIFKRLERCRYIPADITAHGRDGWFETTLTDVTLLLEDPKLLSVVVAAAASLGKNTFEKIFTTVPDLLKLLTRDLNSDSKKRDAGEDLYQIPLAIGKNGKRTTPRNFLLDIANAVNEDGTPEYKLDILMHTLATKVRFDTSGETPKATGVDFLQGQNLYRADPRSGTAAEGTPGSVNALKEVIVAGGTFNSPQLLMLSGIGPKNVLDNVGIPVLVDSPGVGTNMQDHYETSTVSHSPTPFKLTEDCTFLETPDDLCLKRWRETNILKGAYGTNGIPIALLKRSSVNGAGDPTDLVITGAPSNFRGYFPGYSNDSLAVPNFWSWIILQAHPRNRAGSVTLRSSDPRDTPVINFNYYDTGTTANGAAQKDMQAMYEGMQFSRRILDDLVPIDGTFDEVWPGPEMVEEDDIKEFLRKEAWGHHASCTCPIGADGDPNAVLDSKMRVRGVKGLRVVDASVFPVIPGTYTALSTYMVSEKAADDILSELEDFV